MTEVIDNASCLSPEDVPVMSALPDVAKIVILKQISEGMSGDKVLLVDVIRSLPGQSGGIHIAKISTSSEDSSIEAQRFIRAKSTSLGSYMPELRAFSPNIGEKTATLYGLAQGTLFKSKGLSELLSHPGDLQLDYLTGCMEGLASALYAWNRELIHRPDHISYLTPQEQVVVVLGERRCSDLEARLKSALGMNQKATSLRFTQGIELPNPLAWTLRKELWGEMYALPCLRGLVHGDLHSGNILFRDESRAPALIDFADFEVNKPIFSDWAYLELDLLLRLIPPHSEQNWKEWQSLTAYLTSRVQITGAPRGIMAQACANILRPLRESVVGICQGENRESLEIAFWSAAIAAGLNFARKGHEVDRPRRVASLLYASCALKRLIEEIHLSNPEGPPYLLEIMPSPRREDARRNASGKKASRPRQRTPIEKAVNQVTPVRVLPTLILCSEAEGRSFASRIQLDLFANGLSVSVRTAEGKPTLLDPQEPVQRLLLVITLQSLSAPEMIAACQEAIRRRHNVLLLLVQKIVLPEPFRRLPFLDFSDGYLQVFAKLLERLSASDSGEAEQAYLEVVQIDYENWRDMYTPMAGVASKASGRVFKFDVRPTDIDPHYEWRGQDSDTLVGVGHREVFSDIRDAASRIKRFVLLGEPGTGKTTTLRNLNYLYANAAQQNSSAPLPVYAHLGSYTGVEEFQEYLISHMGALSPWANVLINSGRIALFLDGINEMPRADYEDRVKRIGRYLAEHPKLVVVLACRARDYIFPLDLAEVRILPLDSERIRDFTQRYFKEDKVGEALFWGLAGGEVIHRYWEVWLKHGLTWEQFWALESTPEVIMPFTTSEHDLMRRAMLAPRSLISLASNPFMLFMLAQVFAISGELPANRGKLFDAFVDILFRREAVGENNAHLRKGLGSLAYEMQKEGREGTSVSLAFVESIFEKEGIPNLETSLRLAANTSILVLGEQVRFSHQLLQEYFAATYLDIDRMPAGSFWEKEAWWQPTGWEETVILRAGQQNDATALVHWLIDTNPVLAFRCIDESGAEQQPSDTLLELLSQALMERLSDPNTAPVGRAAAARVVNFLPKGDRRLGIGLLPNGLPDVIWCPVQAGSFLIGSDENDELADEDEKPQHLIYLNDYAVSLYPITNVQFEPFRTEGYTNPTYWSKLGWAWLAEQNQLPPWRSPGLANYPRVGITWHEAIAYSNWLAAKMREAGLLDNDETIELPTEPLWSKAARGRNGFLYSWGNDWNRIEGNVDEVNINEVCAVGLFPKGQSPCGAMDMTGNIWEWCRSTWQNYPYADDDGREDINGPDTKVVRGGAYGGGSHSCRCEYRGLGDPRHTSQNLGFRLVRIRKSLKVFQRR